MPRLFHGVLALGAFLGLLAMTPALALAEAKPDLIVTAVGDPPATALPGESFIATATVKNQGSTTAAVTITKFYLVSTTGGAKKNLKGVQNVDSLMAGASAATAVTVAVYSDTTPGTYRLQACADGAKVVRESDESNNCATSAKSISVNEAPDLVVTSIDNPPEVAAQGQAIDVKSTIKNASDVPAAQSTVRYYLVATSGAAKKDLKGTPTVPALDPGQTFTEREPVTVRRETVPGDYFLQACADSGKIVTEENENNNCLTSSRSIQVTTQPNLIVTSVKLPNGSVTVPLRGSFAVTSVVKNAGDGPAGASQMRIFLVNTAKNKTKDLKGHPGVPELASGKSTTAKGNVTVFSDTVPGAYGLKACADYKEVVAETDEDDNCAMASETVTVTAK